VKKNEKTIKRANKRMKHQTKWFASALIAASGMLIASSSQAQYISGDPTLDNVTVGGGSFTTATVGANGVDLTGVNYNWGQYNVAVANQQVFNPADNEIIMQYTINSPAAGTSGADYTSGNAWTWYSLQPLIDTTGSAGLVRYGGYDGYNLPYGFPNGQNIASQDKGYSFNNGVVTLTVPLTAATKADLVAGDTVDYFQISMDPTSTLPDGYDFTINSIELAVAPEPSTLAFVGLGLGLAGLMIARRRVSVS
jgi:PEP-CTERM motif